MCDVEKERRRRAAGRRSRGGRARAAARHRALDRVRQLQRRIQAVPRNEAGGFPPGDGGFGVFARGNRARVQAAPRAQRLGRDDRHFVAARDAGQLRLHGADQGGAGVERPFPREIVQRGHARCVSTRSARAR